MKKILVFLAMFGLSGMNMASVNSEDITLYLTFSNPTSRPVKFTIDAGRIFVPGEGVDGVQALAVRENTEVTIPAYASNYVVEVPAQCLSQSYAYPSFENFQATPLRLNAGFRGMTQAQVWAEFGYQR